MSSQNTQPIIAGPLFLVKLGSNLFQNLPNDLIFEKEEDDSYTCVGAVDYSSKGGILPLTEKQIAYCQRLSLGYREPVALKITGKKPVVDEPDGIFWKSMGKGEFTTIMGKPASEFMDQKKKELTQKKKVAFSDENTTQKSKAPKKSEERLEKGGCRILLKAGPHAGEPCRKRVRRFGKCQSHFQQWQRRTPGGFFV